MDASKAGTTSPDALTPNESPSSKRKLPQVLGPPLETREQEVVGQGKLSLTLRDTLVTVSVPALTVVALLPSGQTIGAG